jgi:hypothetical protein
MLESKKCSIKAQVLLQQIFEIQVAAIRKATIYMMLPIGASI